MLNLKNGNKVIFSLLFCLFSFLAGAINGFVGTGGGIIFIFTLNALTENNKKDNINSYCIVSGCMYYKFTNRLFS